MLLRTPIIASSPRPRGTVLVRRDHCKGCEFCIEFCPTKVLTRSTDFNLKGYHYPVVTNNECINCRLCTTVCPEYAIFAVASRDATERRGVVTVGGPA